MSPRLEHRATTGPLEGIDRIMGLFFGRKNKPIQGDRLETIIGPSTRFTGDLSVDGGVRIDGQFEGSLEAGGNVVIGEQGRVVADISARHITVGGAVKGNVRATGRLEILKTGHVFGDIHASQVLIDDGGVFQGMGLLGAKDLPALAAPAHDALHPLRDIDPEDAEALEADDTENATAPSDDPTSEAPSAKARDAETDDIVDRDLDEVSQSGAQPQGKAQSASPKRAKKNADILSPETKKTRRMPSIAAKARKAGGLGRGLDLKPLDGDLEIEPIIPELGEASTSDAKTGSSAKDDKASPPTSKKAGTGTTSSQRKNGAGSKKKSGGPSNGRKNNKRKSSNRNRRRRSSR